MPRHEAPLGRRDLGDSFASAAAHGHIAVLVRESYGEYPMTIVQGGGYA
jgi:hypothetical protein